MSAAWVTVTFSATICSGVPTSTPEFGQGAVAPAPLCVGRRVSISRVDPVLVSSAAALNRPNTSTITWPACLLKTQISPDASTGTIAAAATTWSRW